MTSNEAQKSADKQDANEKISPETDIGTMKLSELYGDACKIPDFTSPFVKSEFQASS